MWQLLKANFRKQFIELKRYYPNTIAMIISLYFLFLAVFLGLKFVGNPTAFDENVQYTIVSMAFWFIAMSAFGNPSGTIAQEATRGTLEQLYMNPYRPWKIIFSRILALLTFELMSVIVLLIIIQASVNQWLNFNPLTTIPIALITIVSLIGIGFMMAGIAIVFKQIQNVLQIMQFILMGLVFFPLSLVPILEIAPFVKGVNMLRDVMIQDLSLTDFGYLDYASLAGNSLFYLCLGLFIYLRCEKIAKEKGLLSQY